MKTILLPVTGNADAKGAVSVALSVASRFNSHIEALYVRPLPPIVAGEGITVPGDYMARVAEESVQSAEQAHATFVANMQAANVSMVEHIGSSTESITAGWTSVEGVESQVVADTGRAFDVTVIERNREPGQADWRAACEAALFESGRAVLVASDVVQGMIGERIVIAWNGSTETARAIAFAMPFLQQSTHIDIVVVEGAVVHGPDGEQLLSGLKRHGLSVELHNTKAGSDGAGARIVEFAVESGADMIVKGAFTHSRLRQLIFGGATSHILHESPLPVLFAH